MFGIGGLIALVASHLGQASLDKSWPAPGRTAQPLFLMRKLRVPNSNALRFHSTFLAAKPPMCSTP